MHTFAELTRALNRSAIYLRGLQTRFELPGVEGPHYPRNGDGMSTEDTKEHGSREF